MTVCSVSNKFFSMSFILALVLTLAGPAAAQRGQLTVSRNLDELVTQAATIVEGYVVGWSVAKHEKFTNLDILSVTVHVKDVLKGTVGTTFTFRQHISDIRDRYNGAGYRKGQHVLLLVNRVNHNGLTSTSGVGQGRFRIIRDRLGNEWAVNGHANARLFSRMETRVKQQSSSLSAQTNRMLAEQRAMPIPLADLRLLIRSRVEGN